jgi:hypothetical protein
MFEKPEDYSNATLNPEVKKAISKFLGLSEEALEKFTVRDYLDLSA